MLILLPVLLWVVVTSVATAEAAAAQNDDAATHQADNDTAATVDDKFVVAGYLPNYRLPVLGDFIDAMKSSDGATTTTTTTKFPLTDLIMFSLEPSPKGSLDGCCLNDEHYRKAREVKDVLRNSSGAVNNSPPLNLWLTVGGAGRTASFAQICDDEVLTEIFVDGVARLCEKEGFQGVDLDMFRPTSVEEQECLTRLMIDATDRWHEAGLMVSMTLLPMNQKLPYMEIFDKVDRINIMAYDIFLAADKETGKWPHHSNIENVKRVVDILLDPETGINRYPEKIILGIPMYGRNLNNPVEVKTFYEVYDGIAEDEDQDDDLKSGPTTLSSWKGYEWDSPDVIEEKIVLAKNKKLGGIFFWEIGQDKRTETYPMGVLLEKVSSVLREYKSPSMDQEIWDNEEL
jgi:GH18 family chitinase